MPNKNVLNWPSLSTVDINVYPDTLFVADADNNRGYITTIVPNQTKKLWGNEVNDYEANRIAGYPNPKGIYVNEDGEVVNPKFNTNAIIYNPLHVNGDGVLLDALHVMHDSPIYLELFNLYVESIPLGFSPLMDAANDEFGRRGMTIVDKYQRGLPLTKKELEIIEPIYDALLRRLFAPDYMRNIDGGYLDKAELPIIPSIGMSGDLAIKNYLESYPLLEVTVTPNNYADGGPLDWNELSMKDKAAYIRMGVANGYKDIDSIKKVYKEFKKGGPTKEEVFLNSLELSLVKNSRYNTPEWRKFLTDLAFKESSFHPDSLNSIGAKGYFQLMPANRSEVWSYPTQLFEEMYKLTDANILYLRRNMTLEDLNRAEELGIDLYGLIAGAHLGGAKNALKALRGLSNAKDSNNTSVLDYMTKFSQVNSGNFTNIEGRVTPIINPTTVPTIEPAFNKALLREELFHTELPDALRIAPIINDSSRKPEVVIPKPIIVSENDDQTTISGNTLPEVTVTAKAPIDNTQLPLDPLRYFIPQYSLDKPLLQFVSYEPVSTDTAIDRLTQLNNNRNTLLQQDLEDTILRNTLLGTINLDLLRKDIEDLQFYRSMTMNPLALVNSFEDGGEKEEEDGPGFWVRSGLAFSKLIGLDKKYKGEGNRLYAENLYNLVDPTAPYPRGFWDALAFKQIADKAMENKSFPLHRTGHEPLADAAWAKRLGLPYDESYLIDNGDGTYRLNPTYEAEIPTDISFLENRIKANQELLKRYEEKGMDSFDRRQAINKGIQVDTEALKALKETFATGEGKSLNQDANISRKWIDGGAVQYSVSPLSALLNFTIRYNKDNNTLEYSDIYDFNHFEDFVPGKPFTIKGSIKLGDRKAFGGNLFSGEGTPTQQMDKTYDVGFLPEVAVAAPKRWFVGYDDNANPIYTTDYTQSQEYLQNQLPIGSAELNRRQWAFENVGSNGQVRPGLHGDAADLAKAAQLGIGTALTPLAAEPLVEANMPFMEVMARPSTTATRIGSKLFPSWSKALPYTEMADRGLMGYLGTKGMYNTGKDWYNGEIPWYQAVPQIGLEGLMMADAAPVIRTAGKGMDNIERRAIEVAMRSGAGADGLENSLYGIQKLRMSTDGRERLKRIGKYILTGKREGVDGTYNSLAVMKDSRVPGGVTVYGGVGDTKPYDANRKDLVDAFLYRDEIDPSFGLVKVAQGGDFGPHARFIAENYADKASSIPVYEVNTAGAVPETEVISNGKWRGIPTGAFMSNEGAYVNVGGHLRTTGTTRNGHTVRKGQDIWKFLGKDYWPKWLDYKTYNPLKHAILKLGLHEVNRLGTPVITRTKWAPDYQFNGIGTIFGDEKLTKFLKDRDFDAFFDRIAKIPEDFKAYGGSK